MGLFVPVFSAFLLLCFGVQYFREPKEVGPGPLLSSYIFAFSAFLLLWDIRLYPGSLRKLGIFSQILIEFFIASFLLENIMVDFWFPLELGFLHFPTNLAGFIDDLALSENIPCDIVCDFLKREEVAFVASYLLSVFFLLAVLHATRAIDLRLLACGPSAFFGDIIGRFKRFCRKLKKMLGFGMKKRVHIKEVKHKKSKNLVSKSSSESFSSFLGINRKSKDNKKKGGKSKRKDPCDSVLKNSFSDFEMDLEENNDC